jgi:hypothetical protein
MPRENYYAKAKKKNEKTICLLAENVEEKNSFNLNQIMLINDSLIMCSV